VAAAAFPIGRKAFDVAQIRYQRCVVALLTGLHLMGPVMDLKLVFSVVRRCGKKFPIGGAECRKKPVRGFAASSDYFEGGRGPEVLHSSLAVSGRGQGHIWKKRPAPDPNGGSIAGRPGTLRRSVLFGSEGDGPIRRGLPMGPVYGAGAENGVLCIGAPAVRLLGAVQGVPMTVGPKIEPIPIGLSDVGVDGRAKPRLSGSARMEQNLIGCWFARARFGGDWGKGRVDGFVSGLRFAHNRGGWGVAVPLDGH